MTTIYNAPLDKIVELYNLITDSNDDLNEILSAYDNNENQLRNDLNDEIADELLDKYNYDGDYDQRCQICGRSLGIVNEHSITTLNQTITYTSCAQTSKTTNEIH